MTRIVVAPDAFKGSASARTVAEALAAGVREGWPDAEVVLVPIADGGEGTVDVFLAAGGHAVEVEVTGPLGEPVRARYARHGATAVIEMAAASGLTVAVERRVRDATTFGTGELVRHALDAGALRIVLGIGGSATNDGGAGALAALGVRFLDARGAVLTPSPRGLAELAAIDVDGLESRLAHVRLEIACDVTNPLLGPTGASAVYGPQKGATPDDVAFLDAVLARYADVAARTSGRDVRERPGSGAAGGLGFGLATFAGAVMRPGFALVAEAAGLQDALDGARWCITGEGRIDEQTLAGKAIHGVAELARTAGSRVCAFGGGIDPTVEATLAARGVVCFPIVAAPVALETAIADAPALIRAAATRFARLVRPA